MSQESENTLNTLQMFMDAMCSWEKNYYHEQRALIESNEDSSECDKKYEYALRTILERFSISENRNWSRLEDLGCGTPPTYDSQRDTIEDPVLTGKTYTIVAQQNARLQATYKFTFSTKNGEWKIIKKETKDGDKWKRTAL